MDTLIQKPLYLNALIDWKDSEFIKIITGIRRSGKSTLFLLFQNYLKDNGIKNKQKQYFPNLIVMNTNLKGVYF
jgi:predicted AAA+ superfamily ATPase